VGALHPRDEAEKDSGSRTIGSQSALMARFCRKIVPMLSLNNNALVVLNHEYTPIEANGGRPTVKTSGGAKLEYHKSIWLRLKRNGSLLKIGEKFVGFKVDAEVKKNKLAPTERAECTMDFFYGEGFSATSDLLQDALDKGIITKTGNLYYFSQEKIGMIGKVREWMKDHAEEIQTALGA
jgi:RecA/RadA recombinase